MVTKYWSLNFSTLLVPLLEKKPSYFIVYCQLALYYYKFLNKNMVIHYTSTIYNIVDSHNFNLELVFLLVYSP